MAFPDYGDVTKALLDKLRPQIVTDLVRQVGVYNHYLDYRNSSSGKGAPVSDQGYVEQFQVSGNTVWTTQAAPEAWHMTNTKYFDYAGGSAPPTVVAAPAPPEEVPEVPPVEPKRSRMIKLGRK